MNNRHIIIGAGPAGLTTGWKLSKLDQEVVILEANKRYVGGIARTEEYKGYRFDLGGHRFYSKSDEINQIWNEMLPNEFIVVPRLSRIYYNKKFFPYPIEIRATLKGLGIIRSVQIGLSFLHSRIFKRRPESSFEDWTVNRFGFKLYETFFKTYTEKVWGISCNQINKDWAGQRIRGLSLFEAVKNALYTPKQTDEIKTLIKTFIYPRLGPGQLWDAVQGSILSKGNEVLMNKTVKSLYHEDGMMTHVEVEDKSIYSGSHFYSTMILKDFINGLHPAPPSEITHAANLLRYRDFIIVALIIDNPNLFPDNWIYVHDSDVNVGRIQNYKNWSKDLIADQNKTCLGMEYFCNRGDKLWGKTDDELIKLAVKEIAQIGLAKESECNDGCVIRSPNTYPVYDFDYKIHRNSIKNWLNAYFKNVYPIGRGGLHNYNSQDHSMMAAILSVHNMAESKHYDVWAINTDMEYAEEGKVEEEIETRLAPQSFKSK